MAKIRMIKTEVRTSDKVASWPIEVRYFWILLWGYVDDHGKGKDNPLLVKADCFPLDENITSDVIDGWLWLLSDAGVIVRYEVDGTRFVAVRNWAEHQKPQHPGKDLFPAWTQENARIYADSATFMQPSCNTHETCTPELSRVELSRDELFNDVEPVSSYSDDFESWWKAYPRRQGKGKAYDAWQQALRKGTANQMIDSAIKYATSPDLPEVKFVPLPATWLNQERWNDDVMTAKPVQNTDWMKSEPIVLP